jgi:hypothetical protein
MDVVSVVWIIVLIFVGITVGKFVLHWIRFIMYGVIVVLLVVFFFGVSLSDIFGLLSGILLWLF